MGVLVRRMYVRFPLLAAMWFGTLTARSFVLARVKTVEMPGVSPLRSRGVRDACAKNACASKTLRAARKEGAGRLSVRLCAKAVGSPARKMGAVPLPSQAVMDVLVKPVFATRTQLVAMWLGTPSVRPCASLAGATAVLLVEMGF